MGWLGWSFRPMEEVSDLAILVGGLGFASGFGGRYFFTIPVISGPYSASTQWGLSAWSYPAFDVTGYADSPKWANFVLTAWAMSGMAAGTFPAPDGNGSVQDYLLAHVNGWDPSLSPTQDFVDGLQAADGSSVTWGPLGSHAAIIFLAIFAGGLAARAGLFGVSRFTK